MFLGSIHKPEKSILTPGSLWDNLIYHLSVTGLIIVFVTLGFGNHLFGFTLPTDIATFMVYIVFFLLLFTNSLRFSRLLLYTWFYIFFQTFIWNWTYINFSSSLKHFIGLVLFSLVSFSFFSKNIHKLNSIIKIYYRFCFFLVCLAIMQLIFFLLFKFPFFPQDFFTGSSRVTNIFVPEVLDILPRAVGLSTEPSHYVAMLLPAVYIALCTLTGSGSLFNVYNKTIAIIILFGFIISFSIVGYFGLALCLVSIFRNRFRTNFFKSSIVIIAFIGLMYILLQSPIGAKVYSFISVSKDITGTNYTSGDQSSFALLSNLMVALQSLKISHGLGTGLNSHEITYDATISNIFSLSQIPSELNKDNAGALFIRIPSEFGIPGMIAFVYFLIYYKIKGPKIKTKNGAINSMCLVFIIMYCSRTGHYLNILFLFFLALYYYTYILNKKQQAELKKDV